MEEEGEITVENHGKYQLRKLELLAGKDFSIRPVNEAGFVVHNLNRPPNRDADWILVDIDDTVSALSLAKDERDKKIHDLVDLPEKDEDALLDLTDVLARFRDIGEKSASYHIKTHESLVALLKNGAKDGKTASEIRIELEKHAQEWASGANPFIADKEVEVIFRETTFKPRIYSEAVSALKKLSEEQQFSIHSPNIAFFTYGEVDYQLYKALQLAEVCGINSIWLTQKPKGEFLKKFLAQRPNAYSDIETRVSSQDLPMIKDEDISDDVAVVGKNVTGRGIDFNSTSRILMLFDDSPGELGSLEQEFPEGTNVIPVGVRVKRQGTKNYEKDIEVDGIELPVETIPTPLNEVPIIEMLPTSLDIKVAYATEAVRRFRVRTNAIEESKYNSAASFLESKGYSIEEILAKSD